MSAYRNVSQNAQDCSATTIHLPHNKLWLTGAPGHATERWIWQSEPRRFKGRRRHGAGKVSDYRAQVSVKRKPHPWWSHGHLASND